MLNKLKLLTSELSEIVVDHEVFQALLGLLPPPPCLEKKQHVNE